MISTVEIIILILGFAVGIISWLLIRSRRNDYFSPLIQSGRNRIVVFIILLGLIIRVIFATSTSDFISPDEHAHFGYIKFIAENHSLPVQISMSDISRDDYQYYQPPVYYLVVSIIYETANKYLGFSENIVIKFIRLFSVVLWFVTIVAAILFIRHLKLTSIFVELFVIAFIGLLPSYIFISSMINNDNLITAFGAVIFLLAVKYKDELDNWKIFLFSFFTVLAFLTKYTGVMLAVFSLLLMWFNFNWKEKNILKKSLALAVFLLPVMMVLPLFMRNVELYGSIIPLLAGAHLPSWDSFVYGIYRAFKNFLNTFWGVAGQYNEIKFLPAIILGNLVAVIALYGTITGLLKKDSYIRGILKEKGIILFVTLFTVIAGFCVLIYYGAEYGQAQGRFLFPILALVGLWLAIGFKNVFKEKVESIRFIVNTIGVFILISTSYASYSLIRLLYN